MDIELFKHNEEAYKKAKELFEKENKCAIIHPTGTGKSYIALKWLLDNKDKKAIYVTSHLAIKDQLERTIRENNLSLEEDFPNLEIITYSSLLHNNDMKTDLIVLDEFHRAGAPKWGEAVKKFLDNNKESKVLGLTATPVRYLNRNRDMSDEIFGGNVASHITLPKAIAEGILPPPTYINAIYSFKEDIEKIEQKIAKITDNERKKELEKELKLAKRTIENAENIEEIFKKYMTKENGKYLVFCRDINHLEEMKDEANNWFKELNKNVETHYIHSLEDEDHNKYTLDRFHYVKNDNLKLLYSVGMLNEGVHVNDIDGVIMLRPTSSPILYQQQLGRALTTGKNHEPLVFDVVNNIECLKDIELLRDTVIKIMEKSNKPKKEIERMQETFKITDDYKNISTLIKELDINATYGWDDKYELLKKYVESHNGMFPPFREPIIGAWLDTQKTSLKKGKLMEIRKQKLDTLGNWSKNKYDKWEEKYKELEEYIQKHNGTLPPQSNKEIGSWFYEQKYSAIKGTLKKDKIEKMNNLLGDNWIKLKSEKDDEKWEEKYKELEEYIQKHNGKLPPQSNKEIGIWLNNQKRKARTGILSKTKIEKMNNLLGESWTKNQLEKDDEKWEIKFKELEEYIEKHNGELPPQSNREIGSWFDKQKSKARQGILKEYRLEKLINLLGKNWLKNRLHEPNDKLWNKKYQLLKQYVEEHNGDFPPPGYPVIGEWLSHQRGNLKNSKLSEQRKQKLDALGDWTLSSRKKVSNVKNLKEKSNEKKANKAKK